MHGNRGSRKPHYDGGDAHEDEVLACLWLSAGESTCLLGKLKVLS